jgi:hypothetical protein
MRKAVVTIVAGERYRILYDHIASLNGLWMHRWGWDFIMITSIPSDFRNSYSRDDRPSAWIYYMYKLAIPSLFRDYDLIAFLDSDCVINPGAGCLSEYVVDIPNGGFAAVQDVTFDERKLFPTWNRYYYDDLVDRGYDGVPPHPKIHINAGLLLYRPRDVWERWLDLLRIDIGLNEENRLNVYEVQDHRCLFLPHHWNVVWMYERARRGWIHEKSYKNRIARGVNRRLREVGERKRVNVVYRDVSMMHFAFEHAKMLWINRRPPANL